MGLWFKNQASQWGEHQGQGLGESVPGNGCRPQPSLVAQISAAIMMGIAVHAFAPGPRARGTHAVIGAGNGREVENDQQHSTIPCLAQKTEDRLSMIIAVHPLKAGRIEIQFKQCRVLAVVMVEVTT